MRRSPHWCRRCRADDIYHPLAWTPREAHRFLCEIALYGQAGVIVRMPWMMKFSWRHLILDEAQAIKNPDVKQMPAGDARRVWF